MRTIDLITKAGWDIAAAIRGPDIGWHGEALKEVLTMRIRALVIGDDTDNYEAGSAGAGLEASGMMVRRHRVPELMAARYIAALEAVTGPERGGTIHYLTHIRNAALALGNRNLAELAARSRDMLTGEASIPLDVEVEAVVELAGGG